MKKIAKQILITIPLLLLLTNCGIYGRYKRPQSVTAEGVYRSTESLTERMAPQEESLASLSWREFFGDPHLQKLIEQALQTNADLRVAHLTLEQAKAGKLTSGLSFLPNIATTPTINYSGSTESASYKIPIVATWEVDLFGRLKNGYHSQAHAVKQAEAYLHLVQTNVVAGVANAYYTLLMLDYQRAITLESSKLFEETVRIMKLLKEAGITNAAAVAQAEAATFNVLEALATINTRIRTTENSISTLLHLPAGQVERGRLTTSYQLLPEEAKVGIPIELLSSRPDVQIAEENLAMAFYGTNAARGAFLPGIKLTWNGSWANSLGEAITNPATFVWNAVASLVQPLFNNGRNVAALKVAKAKQEQALIQYQQKILEAGAEVSNLAYRYKAFGIKLEYRETQIASLQRALDVSLQLVKLGNSNYLEVITAQNQLLQARLGAASDRLAHTTALIDLYKALGGGAF